MTNTDKVERLRELLAEAAEILEPIADAAKDRAADDTAWAESDRVSIMLSIGELRRSCAVLATLKGEG